MIAGAAPGDPPRIEGDITAGATPGGPPADGGITAGATPGGLPPAAGGIVPASPRPHVPLPPWRFDSGGDVACAFHRALAVVFLVAWISLAAQARVLIGARGLLPLAELVDAARGEDALSFFSFPSLLVLAPSDGVLFAGTLGGIALACLALIGIRTRLCLTLQTFLYLSYAVACRAFLGFQWDNLLLEAGTLAIFLPADRKAPIAHFLFRALLFKLYFESGIAKWQSPIGDWRDGSAMTFYYQTAPLPTALAWFAHHLPPGWHHFESWATLAIELVVPFAIFGPRRARLAAAGVFTLFQAVNAATANYGFFCYLAVALHVFLLDDGDVRGLGARIGRRVPARLRRLSAPFGAHRKSAWPRVAFPARATRLCAGAGAVLWLTLSCAEGAFAFTDADPSRPAARPFAWLLEATQPFRIVNTYHLFAAVTRARIEPEFQVETAAGWTALDFKYKAGAVDRAPTFVAPHQPRVDFLLWFYGLSFARRQPTYVADLLARLCEDPGAVASLFTTLPPRDVRAVRIVFWDYGFTSPDERRATSAWWTRREIQTSPPVACSP